MTITYPEHQYDELVLSVCVLCLLFTPCCHVCSDIVHNVCILFIVYSLSCLFVCKQISLVTDHASMATQWDSTLTLQDCIQMFSQKYVDKSENHHGNLLYHVENNWPVTIYGTVPVVRPTSQLLGYYQFKNSHAL